MTCKQCKQPITGKPVNYPWIPPKGKKEVVLKFCSEKCRDNWCVGDGTGPDTLRNQFRI